MGQKNQQIIIEHAGSILVSWRALRQRLAGLRSKEADTYSIILLPRQRQQQTTGLNLKCTTLLIHVHVCRQVEKPETNIKILK